MENCCRLCSQHEGGMENVFEYAEGLPISVLIMIICPVKIQRNDNLSKLICIECLEVVTSAYQLREISNKNDRKFRIQLSNENIDYDEDTLEYDEKNPMFELKREYIEKIQMTAYEPAPNIAMPPEELLAATMTESSDSDSMMSRPVSRSSRASRKPSTSQTTKKGKFKKPFFCLWCKKRVATVCSLRTHLRKFHIHIDKMFASKRYKKVEHYKCDFCTKSFYFKSAIQNHLLVDHLKQRNDFLNPMKCEYSSCYRQFDQYDIMEKHRKTHKKQPTELLYCSYCNEGFKKITTLFLHKVGNHQQLLRIAVKERPELEREKSPRKASKLNKISKHFN